MDVGEDLQPRATDDTFASENEVGEDRGLQSPESERQLGDSPIVDPYMSDERVFAVGLSMHLSLYDFRVCVHNSDIISQSFLCCPSHYRSHIVGIPKLPEYFWVHVLCPGVSGISGIARCAYSRMHKSAQWVFSDTHVHRSTVESLGLPAGNIRGCMLGWYA